MKKVYLLMGVCLLSGCATPQTILRDEKTGDTVVCGGGTAGSIAGGMIGYSIQKDNAATCVKDYKNAGYKIIKHADE